MIKCISLPTSAGHFYAHYFQARSDHLLVFIPGLMESKAGLFYIWAKMAHYFHLIGHSCVLFDLAGQGDNLLPLSFDIWNEQRNAILNYFITYEIHLIARGIGAVLLTHDHFNFAINPSLFAPVAEKFKHIRWAPSPFDIDSVTPSAPHALSRFEKECFHQLGAEAECIGGLQLPRIFMEQLLSRLPSVLSVNTICYQPEEEHPLFDKQSERDLLMQRIAIDLRTRLNEHSGD